MTSILLVEDNADDEALTLRALRKQNLANDLEVARDGLEAVERLAREDLPLPSLVLLDIKLPKMDGIEVLKRIRSNPRTQLLPVVMLTSSTEDRDLIESYSQGVNSYVRKPVDFTQFMDAVRQLGMYWLVLNERPRSNE
jgi:two-component system, response regulator